MRCRVMSKKTKPKKTSSFADKAKLMSAVTKQMAQAVKSVAQDACDKAGGVAHDKAKELVH